MKNLKITVAGNSVALRIRPPQEHPNNKNYGVILEELLQEKYPQKVVFVSNLASGRATIFDILQKRDEILNALPNYYVINLGVTDASPREIPLWFSDILIHRRESFKKRIFTVFYSRIIKKIRPQLVKLRGKRTWTSKSNFRKFFDFLIFFLTKETNARIIILSINSGSKRIEDALPGSTKSYLEFNKIIKEIAEKYNALFLDTTELRPEIHYPDGIHYSLEGNRVIAEMLFDIVVGEEDHV